MAVDPVTPIAGNASAVDIGGTPVIAVGPNPNGGFIFNPAEAADQGIAVAETIYVDPVGVPGLAGFGTAFAIAPGQTWMLIPGQTTPTRVNAASSGHRFSVVSW